MTRLGGLYAIFNEGRGFGLPGMINQGEIARKYTGSGSNYQKIRIIVVRFICANSAPFLVIRVALLSLVWERGTPSQGKFMLFFQAGKGGQRTLPVSCFSFAFSSKYF